jgi:hypothetical protein
LRIAAALAAVFGAAPAGADLLQPRAPDLAAKYEAFTLVLGPTRRLVYGTYRGTLHLLETRDGKLVESATRDLWSPVIEMLGVDLDGDGQDEIIGYTQNARLFVLRGNDLQDIWNTQEGRFRQIQSLTTGDVDNDGQVELVLVADQRLRIHSGLRDTEEWVSSQAYTDEDIAVGDVDGDGKLEIVLISGVVLDALFREEEWRYEPGFGVEMDLFDIDRDGKLELVTVGADGLIRVFDVDERRVKWN